MKSRTAIIFGGTGLVGKEVINELNNTDSYETIKVFTRNKSLYPAGSKIKEFVVDFDHPETFSDSISGDDLFICIGTTIKKAGSVKRMEEIDRDLPLYFAKIARKSGVQRLAVISSVGANPNSSNYYLRIKGEMEEGLMNMDFGTIAIVRPSLLLGDRKDRRFGETTGKFIIKVFGVFLFGKYRKYRAIEGNNVARAMVKIVLELEGKKIFESDTLQKVAGRK
jgi:uncharacterized protein YbjT (DUF2867 family)